MRGAERVAGIGPALIGGWIGGTVLGALALWSGLGWLAALAAYGFGGSALLVLFAALPALEPRVHVPALRPALVRREPRLSTQTAASWDAAGTAYAILVKLGARGSGALDPIGSLWASGEGTMANSGPRGL